MSSGTNGWVGAHEGYGVGGEAEAQRSGGWVVHLIVLWSCRGGLWDAAPLRVDVVAESSNQVKLRYAAFSVQLWVNFQQDALRDEQA